MLNSVINIEKVFMNILTAAKHSAMGDHNMFEAGQDHTNAVIFTLCKVDMDRMSGKLNMLNWNRYEQANTNNRRHRKKRTGQYVSNTTGKDGNFTLSIRGDFGNEIPCFKPMVKKEC